MDLAAIAKLASMDPDDPDAMIDFNEDDLNDPALLAELDSINATVQPSGVVAPQPAQPAKKPPPSAIRQAAQPAPLPQMDIDAIAKLTQIDPDENIVFDEADLEDPALLADLDTINAGGEPTAAKRAAPATIAPAAAVQLKPQAVARPVQPQQAVRAPGQQQRPVMQQQPAPTQQQQRVQPQQRQAVQPQPRSGTTTPAARTNTQAAAATPAAVVVPTVVAPSAPVSREQQYAVIEQELNKRLKVCSERATHAELLGSLTAAEQWREQERKVQHQLQMLTTGRASGYEPLFQFHRSTRKYELAFPDVQSSELQVSIVRGVDLPCAPGCSTLDSYIEMEFPFPNSDSPQKLCTAKVKNSQSPLYNFVGKVAILRNKSLSAFLKRGKIRFELFHYRFLQSDVSIGKAEIPLADLLTKCEIKSVLEFTLNRKGTGGKLEVRLRLRTPIDGQQLVEEHEQYLELIGVKPVDPKAAAATQIAAQLPAAPAPSSVAAGAVSVPTATPVTTSTATTAAVVTVTPTSAQKQSSVAPATPTTPTNRPVSQSALPVPAGTESFLDVEAMQEDPWCIETMVSNNVLETIITQLKAEIAATPNKAAQLQDHLDNAKLKLSMLEISVQSGKLTMEAYLESLRKKVVEDKKAAMECARLKRMDWAKLALSRVKIMEKEIQEVEAAGNEEDE
eukprot:TRINITY_DN2033_c0_g1_i2.p1 TRINITY_DN2033_c0_g1~~TRINITY_DN2033_c0_g1_i2.p1  ORF type:complete len:677 (-),score=173.32 TRINITY_DN2033_c0_g1_i2:26-2056(-)